MNILDIILVIPLIWFAWKGFSRGLIIELTSLAALIIGIYAAIHFSWFAAEFLTDNFEIEGRYLSIISFIVTFIVIALAVYAIGKLVEKLVDIVALGFINKSLGTVFGILKAAVLLSLILLVINSFDTNQKLISEKTKEGSLLYRPVASIVPLIMPMLSLEDFDLKKETEERVLRQL